MKIDSIIYSPLLEDEEDTSGWFKATINWVSTNKGKTFSTIRGIAKSLCNVQRADIEDIYAELLKYLYQCDDYNINSAYDKSKSGTIVSLEGYVHSLIKCCTLRYLTEQYKRNKGNVGESILHENGEEVNIFDTIGDTRQIEEYTNIMYNLDSVCMYHRSSRYTYGPDIYLIWYTRLMSIKLNKASKFEKILEVFGITKNEIYKINSVDADSPMFEIAKSVSLLDLDDAISIIRKYIYSVEKVEKVIQLY